MRIRSVIMAGTALTPLLLGTATGQTPAASPAPGPLSAPVAPSNPGSVLFPPAPNFSPATQPTLVPTDVGRVRANQTSTGVTRVDIGGGLMIDEDAPKSRSTVTQDFIQKQVPSGNIYTAVRLLPGANVSLNDPFGLNGGNLTVRGFNSDQIGLTINGAPVNDSGNYAVFPQEYVDLENQRQVVLTQGSADLDSPHIGAVGGTLNAYQLDPKDQAGGFGSFGYGSQHYTRVFVRGETGLIGRTKAYISVSHAQADHFRGPGSDNRNHVDMAVNTQIGDNSVIKFYLNYNDSVNSNYFNPSLAQISQFGGNPRTPGYYNQFSIPGTVNGVLNQGTLNGAPPGFTSSTNYEKLRINPFRNLIVSAPSTFGLTDTVSLDVIPYLWHGYGNGGGGSVLSEATGYYYGIGSRNAQGVYTNPYRVVGRDLNGNGNARDTLLYYSPSITDTYRPGIQTKVNWQLDNHRLSAGYFFEYANHRQTGQYNAVNADGTVRDVWGQKNLLIDPDGRAFQFRNQLTNTFTNQFYIGDTATFLNDRLAVDIGLKQSFVTREGSNYLPGATPRTALSNSFTLPSAGLRFKVNDRNQVFASVSTAFRLPQNFTLFDTFNSGTGAIGTANKSDQQPEEALTFEVGHRYQSQLFDTSLTFFATNFRNRLVSSTVQDPSGANTLITSNINAGQQQNRGVDFEIGFRAWRNFRPYVSAEYLHAENRSNYGVALGNGRFDELASKGKFAVRSPEFQAAVGLDYDDGQFFGNAAVKYVGHQYSTFVNDEQIPHIVTGDLTLGYRLQQDLWKAKKPELRLNFINITDEKFLSGVSGIQQSSKAQTGIRGSTIPATGTPNYYVGGGFAVVATLSSGF